MTNERAIELLQRISDSQFDGIHGDERREALEMAVRVLSSQQMDTDSQGLVNDCISRQMAIDAHCDLCPDQHCCPIHNGNICPDIEVFRLLPSAQPQRKTGKWITVPGRLGDEVECNKCHNVFWYWMGNYRFCPSCGADMRGESDEN